jgi:hypothetical protein
LKKSPTVGGFYFFLGHHFLLTDVTQAFYIFKFFFFALGIAAEFFLPLKAKRLQRIARPVGERPKTQPLILKMPFLF